MKNYKKVLLSLMFCLLPLGLFASESVSLLVDEVKEITHPLQIDSYRISSKDKVEVESVVDKKKIRIVGKSEGVCSLQVTSGSISKTYTITVVTQLRKLLNRLRYDLDSIPGLDMSINQDYIVIKGVISNPEHWNHLEKVVNLYDKKCQNYATFVPTAETLVNLKKLLEYYGYTFKSPENPNGQLDLKISPDAITLSGEVYSKKDREKIINQILATQTWLTTGDKKSGDNGKIRCICNIIEAPVMLQVDIVYVAVSRQDIENLGKQSVSATLKAGAGALTNIGQLFSSASSGRSTSGIDIGLDPFQSFLASNGITRIYNAGHVTFLSNGEDEGNLHSGETLYIKVSGIENGSLQKIESGLNIKVKGGLINQNEVALKMDLSLTDVKSNGDDTYTQTGDTIKNSVIGKLDKTIIMGGTQKFVNSMSNSGTALLRNLPVIKWFTSTDSDSLDDLRLIILACPRILKSNKNVEIKKPIQEETAPVYQEVTGIKQETKQKQEAEKTSGGSLFKL